jgi:site-specific DNA-methyltransferase (adenine-specific)
MERFPELQWDRCKNKEAAYKLVTNIEGSIDRMEVAKQVEKKIGGVDKQKKTLFDAYQVKDFFVGIHDCPDNFFNLVEIDPPYAINLEKVKKGYSYEGYNEILHEEYPVFIQSVLHSCFKKMAQDSWLLLWFGPDPWFANMAEWLRDAGFNTTGLVGIWTKGASNDGSDIITSSSGQTHMPNSRLANAYEMFYYAWKGNPVLAKPGSSNVFGYKPIPPGQKTHPTERPMELMSDLLATFGVEGSRVLVPFAGSGNTLISAIQNKMFPIGFDLTQAYKDSYVIKVDAIF